MRLLAAIRNWMRLCKFCKTNYWWTFQFYFAIFNFMKIIIDDQIKEVKSGYARNFLLPQGKAVPATAQAIKELEAKKKKILEELKNLKLIIRPEKIGERGKLFGAITATDIQKALKEKGIKIAKKNLAIENSIKELGDYKASISFGGGQKQDFLVSVCR